MFYHYVSVTVRHSNCHTAHWGGTHSRLAAAGHQPPRSPVPTPGNPVGRAGCQDLLSPPSEPPAAPAHPGQDGHHCGMLQEVKDREDYEGERAPPTRAPAVPAGLLSPTTARASRARVSPGAMARPNIRPWLGSQHIEVEWLPPLPIGISSKEEEAPPKEDGKSWERNTWGGGRGKWGVWTAQGIKVAGGQRGDKLGKCAG